MRRQVRVLVFSVVMLTTLVLVPRPEPANAQFALSPRGILGAVSQPFRGLFNHFHRRVVRHHEAAREPTSKAVDVNEAKSTEIEKAPSQIARETTFDQRNLYESVMAYAFWPSEYGRDFTQFGFGTIAMAITGPSIRATPAHWRQVATTGQNTGATQSAGNDFLPSCDIGDNATSDWVTKRIKRGLRANTKQLRAFDNVRSQLIEGSKEIRSRCRVTKSDSPLERLAELKQRVWAIHDASVLARPAIKAFYDTLTDQQKAEFKTTMQAPPKNRKGAAAPMGEQYKACALQSGGNTQGLLDNIEKITLPTREQRAGLDNLRKVSSQFEKMLLASCAQPLAETPLARLDAADDQLVTLNYAASSMEFALNNFYSTLDSDQKANFDALGR